MVTVKRIKKKKDPITGKPEAGGAAEFEQKEVPQTEIQKRERLEAVNLARAKRNLPGITREQLPETRVEKLPERAEEAEEVKERIEPIIGELQEKIAQPPEIQGTLEDVRAQRVAQIEQNREFFGKLFTGKATSAEIIAEAKKFATAGAVVGGVAAGLTFAAPIAASTALKTVISSKVGASALGLAGSVGLYFVGGKLTDLDRGEIQTSKRIISGMVEEGERIEADVRNGLDSGFAVDRLEQMAVEIEKAESATKLASIYNLKYRLDDESLADQQDIIKAREAIRRRLRAVENIAITGTAALDVEALIAGLSQR